MTKPSFLLRVALVLLALVIMGGMWRLHHTFIRGELTVWWQGSQLRITSITDGPFVVTHLVYREETGAGAKAVATLPQPIALIDSHGATITPEKWAKLEWLSATTEEQVPAPPAGATLSALYVRPETTQMRASP